LAENLLRCKKRLTHEGFHFGRFMVYPPGDLLADRTSSIVFVSTDLADTSAFSNRRAYHYTGF
jgi:hypothetical protein